MHFEPRLLFLAITVIGLIISLFRSHRGNAALFEWIVDDDGSDADSGGGESIGDFFG